MAERSSVSQIMQISAESVAGTAQTTGFKSVASLELSGGIKADNKKYRPAGRKWSSFVVPGKEWSEWKIGGQVTYGEVVFPLSGIFGYAAPTTDGTLPKLWTFAPAISAEDAIKTFTVEMGSATRAHKFAYGLISELGFKFTRDGVEYDGSMIGQRITDNITMTGSPTAIETPPVPVAGTQISVSYATSWAGLSSATAYTRLLTADWKVGNRFNPLWVLDASKNSFVAHTEGVPNPACTITMEADAQGMALLDDMRAATFKWVRISCTGANIETSKPWLFQIDGCYNVLNAQDFKDQDGVYAVGWQLEPVYDSVAAKTFEITVRNKVASL